MASNTPFNRFVQARHTGATPYRRQESQYQPQKNCNAPIQSGSSNSSDPSRQNREVNTNPTTTKKTKSTGQEKLSNLNTCERTTGLRKQSIEYIILPEPDNGPTFQRRRLQEETSRLLDVVRYWDDVRTSTTDLPESVVGEIDSTVGGIKLMLSSKFEQFRGLVDECAARYRVPSGIPVLAPRNQARRPKKPQKPPVKPDDLDGFWEMMNVQLNTIRKRIEDLENLRDNKWEPQRNAIAHRTQSSAIVTKSAKKPVGKSKFREFLRKQKQEECENKEEPFKTAGPTGQVNIDLVVTAPSPQKKTEKASATPMPLGASKMVPLGTPNMVPNGNSKMMLLGTPDMSGFATPVITVTTPMPGSPTPGSWDTAADAFELERILLDIYHSTPKPTRVSSNGVMFAPYDPSDHGAEADRHLFESIDKEKSNILNETTLKPSYPGSRRASGFATPRAEFNKMTARRSRSNSIGILMQQSFLGKLMFDMEEEEESSPVPSTSEASDTTYC